jgi:ketosteroid isomerase-like protein
VSDENVEVIKQMFDAFNRDPPSALAWLDPEVEWDMRAIQIPGLADVYRGLDELQRFWAQWFQAIEDYRVKVIEFIDAGDAVVVVMDAFGRGRGSGIEIERRWFDVYRLRDAKVVSYRTHREMSDALKTAGLGE